MPLSALEVPRPLKASFLTHFRNRSSRSLRVKGAEPKVYANLFHSGEGPCCQISRSLTLTLFTSPTGEIPRFVEIAQLKNNIIRMVIWVDFGDDHDGVNSELSRIPLHSR